MLSAPGGYHCLGYAAEGPETYQCQACSIHLEPVRTFLTWTDAKRVLMHQPHLAVREVPTASMQTAAVMPMAVAHDDGWPPRRQICAVARRWRTTSATTAAAAASAQCRDPTPPTARGCSLTFDECWRYLWYAVFDYILEMEDHARWNESLGSAGDASGFSFG